MSTRCAVLQPLQVPAANGGGPAASMVLPSADFTRLFLGRKGSGHRRRVNVGVVTLDAAGLPELPAAWYRDAVPDLPETAGMNASVNGLAYHPTLPVLYVGSAYTGGGTVTDYRSLTVYGLDAPGGNITGLLGSYVSAVAGVLGAYIQGLTVNAAKNRLYLGGLGWNGLTTYALDPATGLPTGAPSFFAGHGNNYYTLELAADGTKLYASVSTAGPTGETVEVFLLNGSGDITSSTTYALPGADMPLDSTTGVDRPVMALGPKALYFMENRGSGYFVAVWQLDGSGNPTGAWTQRTDIPLAPYLAGTGNLRPQPFCVTTVGANSSLNVAQPWNNLDAISAVTKATGVMLYQYALNADGTIASSPTLIRQDWGVLCGHLRGNAAGDLGMVLGPNGNNVNLVTGWQARITYTAVTGVPGHASDIAFPWSLHLGGPPGTGELITSISGLNAPSAWLTLDQFLVNSTVNRVLLTWTPPIAPTLLSATIEIRDSLGVVFATFNETVQGRQICLLLPGYMYGPPASRPENIRLLSTVNQLYKPLADAVALGPTQKPKLFPVSSSGCITQIVHQQMMADQLAILGGMGFNASQAWIASGFGNSLGQVEDFNLAPGTVSGLARAAGIKWGDQANFVPAAYGIDELSNAVVDAWYAGSSGLGPKIARLDRPASEVVNLFVSDEPGWTQTATEVNPIRASGTRAALWRTWLQANAGARGLTPGDFGAASWTDATLLPISYATYSGSPTLTNRRLWYWTVKYISYNVAEGFAFTRQRIADPACAGVAIAVRINENNWMGHPYDPGTDVGHPDWFDMGRFNAGPGHTETWKPDCLAAYYSIFYACLRSAAALGTQTDLGTYIIGVSLSGTPKAGIRWLLPVLANGGKYIDWYEYGPGPLSGGQGWTDNPYAYQAIAEANTFLARCEDHLWAARPRRGNVAILTYNEARVFDTAAPDTYYGKSCQFAYLALALAGYAVDYVDQDDIAAGCLTTRGYQALFGASPNVRTDVQALIAAWVNAGGILVGDSGFATRDEYDTASTALDATFGVTGRSVDRTASASENGLTDYPALDTVSASDVAYGTGAIRVTGRKAVLTPTTATVKATWATGGGAALTVNPVGSGRAYCLGFFLGWEHWASATWPHEATSGHNALFYPYAWGAALRGLVQGMLAGVSRPVTVDRPDIEVKLLESAAGTSLVVISHTTPQTNVAISYPASSEPHTARSANHGALHPAYAGGIASVTLPTLEAGDVLLLRYDELEVYPMPLSILLERAKRRYGYNTGEEDALLTDALFLDRVNECLMEMADAADGFGEDFTLDLPLATPNSLGPIPLSLRLRRIEDLSLRIDYDGSGQFLTQPTQSFEQQLRVSHDTLEQHVAGTPRYYFTQRGLASAPVNLILFPQSDRAVLGGIKFAASTYPPMLALPGDLVPLQQGEERFLVPGVCLALAETELSRGRRDAPVALWQARWQAALSQFSQDVDESNRGNRRRQLYVPDEDYR